MTLKTLTGPTVRAALEDARRLFGPTVVLLQSARPTGGQPASVTVGYDADASSRAVSAAPSRPSRRTAPVPVAPAHPAPAPAAPRAYGYAARNARPPQPEPVAVPRPAPAIARPPAEPSASASDVAALRAQLARLEDELSRVRHASSRPSRAPLVLVGPAGSGKTSLALRLARRPDLLEARCPAVLIVAPDDDLFLDPSSVFWGSGVPVAVVRSPADVLEALEMFADADAIVVDTPALPSDPERARAAVARLGTTLAPLAAVDVTLVVDGARPPAAFSIETSGLRPDAVAVTRMDETSRAPSEWADHVGVPLQFTSSGGALEDVSRAHSRTSEVAPINLFEPPPAALEVASSEAPPPAVPEPAVPALKATPAERVVPGTDLASLLPDVYADFADQSAPSTPVFS